jgi:hypothetical protein
MTDDFDDLRDDDLEEEEGPAFVQSPDLEEEDEFGHLRRKSARVGSAYGETMVEDEMTTSSSGGFSLGNFTPAQRLVLAILVFLDILAIGFGILVITGRFG